MFFPKQILQLSQILDYINNEDFETFIFQFQFSNAYYTSIGSLICYAMDKNGANMNPDPIILENSFESADISLPFYVGNLVPGFEQWSSLTNKFDGADLKDVRLIFTPFKDLAAYIGYDISYSVRLQAMVSANLQLNPCPPRCQS